MLDLIFGSCSLDLLNGQIFYQMETLAASLEQPAPIEQKEAQLLDINFDVSYFY